MSTEVNEVWPEGVARHVLGSTDSTMAEAARLAPHLAGPAWILALSQTGARGRRGRPWRMPAGNFAATYLFRPEVPAQTAALYSFVAALAVYDALAGVAAGRADLSIKWPNDVLLNGGKVSGILLETLGGTGAVVSKLSVGIGVNLAAAPGEAEVEPGSVRPVSLMGETGVSLGPEAFLSVLAPAFEGYARRLRTFGFAPIREAWLARAARLGERVVARTGSRTRDGIFETIDETGAMLLRGPSGVEAISAADVFF